MSRGLVGSLWLLVLSCRVAAGEAGAQTVHSDVKPEDVEKKPYVAYVKQCADLLIQYGTDRYGKTETPLLMNILDVHTRSSPENPLPLDEAVRVVRRERRGPAGCNLYPDQPTLQAMFTLSEMTHDRRGMLFASRLPRLP